MSSSTNSPTSALPAWESSAASRPPRVWVLNLDAEHELEAGAGFRPERRLRAIVAEQQARLVPELLWPGDFLLREVQADGSRAPRLELLRVPQGSSRSRPLTPRAVALSEAAGRPGLAWSPTPRALAMLSSVGAVPDHAPDVDVLRAVNARPFAALQREALRGESFDKHVARTLDEALERLADPAPLGWLVRRTFGAAGRGRRRIRAGVPEPAEREWLVASLRRGPLVLEPWVEVTREFTRSGWVESDGAVLISRPCFQETASSGAWQRTEHAAADELSHDVDQCLQASFEAAGRALAEAGYRGPFGIDAYLHRTVGGRREVLNPLSEINARFTMDWALALDPLWSGSRGR